MIGNPIRVRAVLIGLGLSVPAIFWGVYGDVVSQTDLTSTSLMMPPFLCLIGLLIWNALTGRIRPSWALDRAELITIYIMLTVSVVLSGMGMIQFLCTTIAAPYHYRDTVSEIKTVLPHLPSWLLPDENAVKGFYRGKSPIPWSAWLGPCLIWGTFLFAMVMNMLVMSLILRPQWMERERLTYPIAQLPLEMTENRGALFRSRAMWAGFLIAAVLESMNSLNFLFPNVPYIQLRAHDLMQYITTPPWNAAGYFPITFYPLAIGLGFLLPLPISFSCWFFYLFTKAEGVFVAAIGWTPGAGAISAPPWLAQQGVGGFLAIAGLTLWLARVHLAQVLRAAVKRTEDPLREEALGSRQALLALGATFAVMAGITVAAGMSPVVACVFLLLYLALALTITRFRAEAGPAWTMGPYMNSMDAMIQGAGSINYSAANLSLLGLFNWFSVEMRCTPMPLTAESLAMGRVCRLRQRALLAVITLAVIAGIAIGFWACLTVWYQFGADSSRVEPWRTMMGRVSLQTAANYIRNPQPPDLPGVAAAVVGAAFTVFLSVMRTRFVWFPFHPAGYVLANSGTLYWLWLPFLLAWLAKSVIMKIGGITAYRNALPFFLGLVIGDYVTSGLWALLGSLTGMQMYRCFPC